ncbi:hypothetical protein VNO77_33382 [Canavalia gladiata]|uniref:Uncharacterized protein n=1 Tax=Canavalia gladiata TaxID=3824 RepID=A0AAN9PYV0_CANGL
MLYIVHFLNCVLFLEPLPPIVVNAVLKFIVANHILQPGDTLNAIAEQCSENEQRSILEERSLMENYLLKSCTDSTKETVASSEIESRYEHLSQETFTIPSQ